jgi:uncharacterized protein YyaL (SSP411 family)
VALTDAQIARFWDEARGGFYESPADDPALPLRMKNDHDGAELSGNSIATANLLVLGALLDRADLRERAERTLALFAARLEESPVAMPLMLVAMAQAAAASRHVVIAGRLEAPDTLALRREFDRRYLPDDLLLLADPADASGALARLAPWTGGNGPDRRGGHRLRVHGLRVYAAHHARRRVRGAPRFDSRRAMMIRC